MSDTEKHVYHFQFTSEVDMTEEEARETLFAKFIEYKEFRRFIAETIKELVDDFVVVG